MSRLLYIGILKPLSLLPLPLLYRVSDLLFYLVYYLVPYRKKVVFDNLNNAFPLKSKAEIRLLAKAFYRHFCDFVFESVRMFSIGKKEALERCRVRNPNLLDKYFEANQSLIIIAGHYGNWEMAGVALDKQIRHQAIGFYTPIKNRFFDRVFRSSRSQFGLKVSSSKKVKQTFEEHQAIPTATVFIADQAPSNIKKQLFWTTFLNQDTGIMLGAEKMARHYGYPVLYGHCRKLRRGYYEVEFEIVEEHPGKTSLFEITEKHSRILEKEILKAPQYWLWTHRRWKRKRIPVDNRKNKK